MNIPIYGIIFGTGAVASPLFTGIDTHSLYIVMIGHVIALLSAVTYGITKE